MRYGSLITRWFFIFCLTGISAEAASWSSGSGTGVQGHPSAFMSVETADAALSFSCDERARDTDLLQMVLVTPPLPNLPAKDDMQARLTVRFSVPDGNDGVVQNTFWYFDGDGAWVGHLKMDALSLQALENSHAIDVLNDDGDRVFAFAANGADAAGRLIRQQCKIGLPQ